MEDFPIDENCLNEFVQVNQNKWDKQCKKGKTVVVNLSMVRMQVAWVIPKLLYARGVADAIDGNVIVLTWRENPMLTELVKSFGFEHIALDTMSSKNIVGLIKALLKTMMFLITDGTGAGLKKLKACNVTAGKSLYEDIIRTSSLSTIRSVRKKVCIKKMIHILLAAYSMERLINRENVQYAVLDDVAYHEGLFMKMLLKRNLPVYMVDNWRERKVPNNTAGNIELTGVYFRKIITEHLSILDESSAEWSEQYLMERFEGKNGRNIDRGAFKDKRVITRENLQKELKIDPKKKNIVIMAHTFTDAVFNYGDIYFRDYYDWLEQTLKIAQKVEDVNWILKPHPTRSAYNESEDSIEDMFERYKTDNMVMLSDEVSAESIKNIADAIVTIGGNAGAEFACFGVPVVIVGKPYYADFGYTEEPKDFDEYQVTLRNIKNIQVLNEKQIELAKKVFCLRNNTKYDYLYSYFHDELSDMVNEKYNKMLNEIALQYFANNNGTKVYNDEILRFMIEYFNTHDLKECAYYLAGRNSAMNEKNG